MLRLCHKSSCTVSKNRETDLLFHIKRLIVVVLNNKFRKGNNANDFNRKGNYQIRGYFNGLPMVELSISVIHFASDISKSQSVSAVVDHACLSTLQILI